MYAYVRFFEASMKKLLSKSNTEGLCSDILWRALMRYCIRYYSFLIIQSTYKLDKKYKSILANKHIELSKDDKKYKKKYKAIIQCDKRHLR